MKRLIGSVTAMCLVLASVPRAASLESVQDALPVTKRVVSKKEFIEGCRKNDQKIFNVNCAKVAEAVGIRLEYKFENVGKFLEYLELLEVKPLPQRETRLGRVMPNDTIDMYGFKRMLREGEMGLFDNQLGIYILSLSCGNPITDPLPVFTAMITDEPPQKLVDQMEDAARSVPVERERDKGIMATLSKYKKPLIIAAIAAVAIAALAPRSESKATVIIER